MAAEGQREQVRGQSGAGMAAEHVRLFGIDLSPKVRRFRHVRFAVMCAMEVPQRSPQADARLFDDAWTLRQLAAELIAEGCDPAASAAGLTPVFLFHDDSSPVLRWTTPKHDTAGLSIT